LDPGEAVGRQVRGTGAGAIAAQPGENPPRDEKAAEIAQAVPADADRAQVDRDRIPAGEANLGEQRDHQFSSSSLAIAFSGSRNGKWVPKTNCPAPTVFFKCAR